jgi:hypothetical protein
VVQAQRKLSFVKLCVLCGKKVLTP